MLGLVRWDGDWIGGQGGRSPICVCACGCFGRHIVLRRAVAIASFAGDCGKVVCLP